jgi:hypothetical protein
MLPNLISSEPSTIYPSFFDELYHDLRRVSQNSLLVQDVLNIPDPGAQHESVVRPDLND